MSAVAVVGAGSIGVAWSIAFARGGLSVSLQEPDDQRRSEALLELHHRLADLAAAGLLDEDADRVADRVTLVDDLGVAVSGVDHVQECAPELLRVKRELFAELDALTSPDTTLASSSSAIRSSVFASEVPGRERCLVAHPGNPPHLLPIVELVPAPFTADWAVDRVEALMQSVGMSPVRLRTEIEGFVFNRLQGAVLREAYCLVRDGVISARDLDTAMVDGLGRRWSVIGPFATAELNTRGGIEAHAMRLGDAYARMGAERGQDDPWTDELVANVAAELHVVLAPEHWDENVRARDRALMILERCRREHAPIVQWIDPSP